MRTSFEVTLKEEGSLRAWRTAISSARRGVPLPSSSPEEEESKVPIFLQIRFRQVLELESFHRALSVIILYVLVEVDGWIWHWKGTVRGWRPD